MKKIEAIKMAYWELDKLVRETWPAREKFESIAEFEWNNEEDHLCEDIGVPPVYREGTDPAWIAKTHQDNLQDMIDWGDGKKVIGFGCHQVLEALVHAGKISAGSYCVEVFW